MIENWSRILNGYFEVRAMPNIMKMSSEEIESAITKGKLVISVYGLGWMGLPTACLYAEKGARVIGVDIDSRVIERINRGESPIAEPNLRIIIKNTINKSFRVTSDVKESASISDIMIIIVPTIIDEKKKPDYSALEKVAREIGLKMNKSCIIIVESTVGPGITDAMVKDSLESSSGFEAGTDFGLAYSPIRAMAGRALHDIRIYPRIVGGINRKSVEVASIILKAIGSGEIIKVKNIISAETTKLFENIYRDVNIALANELSIFCEKARIDFKEIKKAANTQPYCHLHEPGIGVGGHCIPYNPYFLIDRAEEIGFEPKLIKYARKINDSMPNHIVKMIKKALQSCRKSLKRSKIAILGISYRANVKEIKNSPAYKIINMLLVKGAKVLVYDPYFRAEEMKKARIPFTESLEKSIDGADCVVFTVSHDIFKSLKPRNIVRVLRKPACIIDGCRIFNPEEVKRKDIIYYGVGLGQQSLAG